MVESVKRAKNDIFGWPVLGYMFKNRKFIIGLRLFTTLLLFAAIYFGFVYPQRAENPFTNAVFWSIFWPFFMVLTLPTLGSVFCGICPHGFIGRYLTKWGLQKKMPKVLRNPYISLIILLGAYWFTIYTFPGMLKTPWISALFFALLTLLAFSFYFLFKDMAYCQYICPIGPLTKAYSKASFTWLHTYEESCSSCKTFECAQVCTHKQSPFLFDKNGSMGECTLCMDCAEACEAVAFKVTKPSSSLWSRLKKPKIADIWVYILILASATIAMRFHHGLARSGLAPDLPWSHTGNAIAELTGISGVDWVGFSAFFMALGVTLFLTVGSYYLIAKLFKIPMKTVMLTLGYALAPLMLLGAFNHALSFFFYHYASDIASAYYWVLGESQTVAPLASRKDGWLRLFSIFSYVAVIWSSLLLYKRVKMLELQSVKARVLTFIASGSIIWFYLFMLLFTIYAFATYGALRHH